MRLVLDFDTELNIFVDTWLASAHMTSDNVIANLRKMAAEVCDASPLSPPTAPKSAASPQGSPVPDEVFEEFMAAHNEMMQEQQQQKDHSLSVSLDQQHAEISSLKISVLKKRARVLGATSAQMDEVDDADDTRAAIVALTLSLRSSQKVSALKKRLRIIGATEEQIDELDDVVDTKSAAVELLFQLVAASAGAEAGAISPVLAAAEPQTESNDPLEQDQDDEAIIDQMSMEPKDVSSSESVTSSGDSVADSLDASIRFRARVAAHDIEGRDLSSSLQTENYSLAVQQYLPPRQPQIQEMAPGSAHARTPSRSRSLFRAASRLTSPVKTLRARHVAASLHSPARGR